MDTHGCDGFENPRGSAPRVIATAARYLQINLQYTIPMTI
jgi:hypothetical protein